MGRRKLADLGVEGRRGYDWRMESHVNPKSTIGFRRSWTDEAASIARFTAAGAKISEEERRSATQKVSEAVPWAAGQIQTLQDPLIPITPIPADKLQIQVADRRGLLEWLGQTGDRDFVAPWVICPSGRYAPATLSATTWSLNSLARHLHFGVSLSDPSQQIYCVPNVLQTAQQIDVDVLDLAKWLALRGQCWANLVQLLPWLQPYLSRTLKTSGPSLQQALLLTLMFSAVVDAQMLRVDSSLIPSVRRIRTQIGRYDNVRVLETFPVRSLSQTTRATKNQVAIFARKLFQEVPKDKMMALPQLFATPEDLPTIHELSNIRFWLERRGLV